MSRYSELGLDKRDGLATVYSYPGIVNARLPGERDCLGALVLVKKSTVE